MPAETNSNEATENRLTIVLAGENDYMRGIDGILKFSRSSEAKICYVCISRPYKYVSEDLIKGGIDTGNFFFIDVLSSHYEKPASARNCVFVDSPLDMRALEDAISRTVSSNCCESIVFDTISTMLAYHQPHTLLRFAHQMTRVTPQKDADKLLIILREDIRASNEGFVKDLEMFADRKIELAERAQRI